jgi:ABC-type long-subunit fatty acid transport system fused permease/ATPase subunit
MTDLQKLQNLYVEINIPQKLNSFHAEFYQPYTFFYFYAIVKVVIYKNYDFMCNPNCWNRIECRL